MNSEPQFIEFLFGFLLEAGLQSILIVPLILTIQFISGNRLSPTTKHALWLLLLVRLSLPIFPESSFSLFQLTQRSNIKAPQETNPSFTTPTELDTEPIATDLHPPYSPLNTFPFSDPQPELTRPPLSDSELRTLPSDNSTLPIVFELPTSNAEAVPVIQPKANGERAQISFPKVAISVWFLGLLSLSMALVRNALHYQRLIQSATAIQEKRLLTIIDECRSLIGLSREIPAIESPSIASPAILGFLRPKLLLPSQISTRYKTSELRHILLHELAHVQRQDPVWNWWATMVQIIHWPNPFVWYAIARQRGDRELATDYLALKALQADRPEAYGRTLIKTLNGFSRQKLIPGLIGIGEDRRGLKKRFRMIAAFRCTKRYSIVTLVTVISPLLALLLTDPKTHQAKAQGNPNPTDSQGESQAKETSDLTKHKITVIVTEAGTGKPLPEIPIGFSSDPRWHANTTPIQIVGRTTDLGEAAISIPLTNDTGKPLTLLALPNGSYSAQAHTWLREGDSNDSFPSRHSFEMKPGRTIGGEIRHADGRPAAGLTISLAGHSDSQIPTSPFEGENTVLRVLPSAQLNTDANGKWTYSGAPDKLAYAELAATDRNGNRTQFETARYHGAFRFHLGKTLDLSDLLQRQSQVQIPITGTVELRVTNESGQAVPNATIVEMAGLDRTIHATLESDSKGRAAFNRPVHKEFLYLVSHPDYAERSLLVKTSEGAPPTKIRLSPARPLRGKITDKTGTPLAGASITITKRIHTETYSTTTLQTLPDGTFQWNNAPRERAFYEVSAPGYAHRIYDWVNNGEVVHGTLLKVPSVERSIKGLVIDAVTRKPIHDFYYDSKIDVDWIFSPQWLVDVENGQFDIPQPDLWNFNQSDEENTAQYRIIVGAEGYEAITSRAISKHEFGTQILFALRPLPGTKELTGTRVFYPDKTPAGNIPLLRPSFSVVNRDHISIQTWGAFPNARHKQNLAPIYTDEQGFIPKIPFPPNSGGLTILARQSSLTLSFEDLQTSLPRLELKPSGKVLGKLTRYGQPLANQQVWLTSDATEPTFISSNGQVETDAQGQFEFPHVPYGKYHLGLVNFKTPKTTEHVFPSEIEISPGKTTVVPIDIKGTLVTGRVTTNTSSEEINWTAGTYELRKARPKEDLHHRPVNDDFVIKDHFEAATRNHLNQQRRLSREAHSRYYARVTPTGHFTIDGVKPGDYVFNCRATDTSTGTGTTSNGRMFWASHRLSVPVGAGGIDLGAVVLKRIVSGKERNTPAQLPILQDHHDPSSNITARNKVTRNLLVKTIDTSTGAPVANATINIREFWKDRNRKASPPQIKATTDSTGEATLQHIAVSADQLKIELTAPGYAAVERWLYPKITPLPEPLIFQLIRGGQIHGLVVDQVGTPVAEVQPHISLHTQRGLDYVKSQINLPLTGPDGTWSYDGIPSNAVSVAIEFRHPTLTYTTNKTIKLGRVRKDSSTRSIRFEANNIRERLSNTSPIKTVLTPGGQLRGQVLGPDNTPIVDASIRVIRDGNFQQRSNQWGWFEFPGSYAGHRALQVTAKGFAPKVVETTIDSNLAPLSITLEPSQKVRFKVMTPSRQPIENVRILVMDWNETNTTLGIQGTTNENGEWLMESAPTGAVDYVFIKDGYHYRNEQGLQPSEAPHEIILTPALMVTFNVVDKNDQAIPRFSIQRGRLSPARPPEKWTIRWFRGPFPQGSDGTRSMTLYSDTFEFDSDIQGKHIFKLEAFGYEPFVTRVVDESESPTVLSVSMQPTASTPGLLTTSDGRPVPSQAILVADSTTVPQLRSASMHFQYGSGKQIQTDHRGRFHLPSTFNQDATLLVACTEGFGMIEAPSTGASIRMVAHPWANISGALSVSGKPFPYQRIAMRLLSPPETSLQSPRILDLVRTDREGRFHLEHVPAGTIQLLLLTNQDSSVEDSRVIKKLTVKPGSSLSLDIPISSKLP